jgi:SNF2 family DNA or RNA helicase
MGMGKTMQAIALMLSNRPPRQPELAMLCQQVICSTTNGKKPSSPRSNGKKSSPREGNRAISPALHAMLTRWDESDRRHYVAFAVSSTVSEAEKQTMDFPRLPKAGTLVMVPTIALRQWQMEIARFCKENALTVGVSSNTKYLLATKNYLRLLFGL